MSERILNKRYKIYGHLLFWVASIILWLIIFFYNENRIHFDLEILIKAIIINLGFAFGVYMNIYILIPKFLKQKNYVFFIFWLIILLTLASIIIQVLVFYPLRNLLSITESFSSFNTSLHSAYFTSLLKFIKDWLSLQDLNFKLAKIEKQKLEAELKTLKGQLNPHFLFNSLNNIYSLALVKSDKVPDLILKLSDLMRHIIYDSKEKYISLEKEICFVNNFIELQKIRISGSVSINYTTKGSMPRAQIAPLLFEPFIDNAFKHGLPGYEKDFINITFDFTNPEILFFLIENNFEDKNPWENKHSGIGIANVKQRLKLLYKDSDYKLYQKATNNTYSTTLKLKLK